MAVSVALKRFLEGARVKYAVAKHPPVYTAQEIAAAQHVSGRQLAKSVLVKTNQGVVLAVLPAVARVNLGALKRALRATQATIAKETDIRKAFPDLEVGAMSPFGQLYQVPVILDTALEAAGDIVFNAGSHTDTIRMACRDVIRLTGAKTASFTEPFPGAAPKKTRAGKRPAKKPKATRAAAKKRPAPKTRKPTKRPARRAKRR